ncbi:FecR family protein [Aggregatimonas sangjinii]|uniref:FecR family protein n=1 Tax=Aggregatimonas sangjinii TaxID=2583587 RepID=A0A5B7SSZ8_9FLAO|nr:FecR family protein [Aggregatimonas sangjinii]QCW99783.1 FecR family protein [Aggregatimonas sangjinii]
MKYRNPTLLKSLLNDSSFKNWVNKSNKNDILFWNRWISENPQEIETVETAKAIIIGVPFKKSDIDDGKVTTALENVLQKIDGSKTVKIHPKARNNGKKHLFLAAAAISLVLFGLFSIPDSNTEVVHKTGFGEIIELKLSDGTTVTLNGNSEIKYDKKNSRDITLKGEAYFKVKPIPSTNAKFWVNTNDLRVEVYGTQFHVNTREKKTNVLLDEGSIHLLLKNGAVRKMAPGEIVSFSKENNDVVHEKVNNDLKYSLWREGTYIFNNTNLKEVMKYVNYTYGLSSEFVDKDLELKTITGGIPNQNLKICLSAIEKSTGTRIVVKDKKLFIIKNEN